MTGEQFRDARLAFGQTQEQWAKTIGVHRVQVARIETGVHRVSPTIAKLVEAYLAHGLPVLTANASER